MFSESIDPDQIAPFLNEYAQAAIDAIHEGGGDVLKLIRDGAPAMFAGNDLIRSKRQRRAPRSLSAEDECA